MSDAAFVDHFVAENQRRLAHSYGLLTGMGRLGYSSASSLHSSVMLDIYQAWLAGKDRERCVRGDRVLFSSVNCGKGSLVEESHGALTLALWLAHMWGGGEEWDSATIILQDMTGQT